MHRLALPALSAAATLAIGRDWQDLGAAVLAAVLSAVLNWLMNRKEPKP